MKLLLLFLLAPALQAQTAAPVLIASWSHTGLDVQGNPEVLRAVEYAMVREGAVGPNTELKNIEARTIIFLTGDWKAEVAPKIVNRPAAEQKAILESYRADDIGFLMAGLQGSTYRVWCRVSDASGNWSRWAASIGTLNLAPAAPMKVEAK